MIAAILLFLVLAPSSRAEAETTPPTREHTSMLTAPSHGTNDSRHAYPTH